MIENSAEEPSKTDTWNNHLQDMGFTAIWISPVVENLLPNGYHGYYAQNIWSELRKEALYLCSVDRPL